MKQYLDLLKDVLENGQDHEDRTGVGRRSVFGRQLRFDLREGFPLVTTRKINTKAMIYETIWFLSGNIKIDYLRDNGIKIWDKWTVTEENFEETLDGLIAKFDLSEEDKTYLRGTIYEDRELLINTVGPMYGHIWRGGQNDIDQIQILIDDLKNNPFSSRHIVNGWDVEYKPQDGFTPKENVLLFRGALSPCHMLQQYMVTVDKETGEKELSLQLYIRSNDLPIGAPYNISQYSLLLSMIAQVVGMKPKELIYTIGDAHIYLDQIEKVKEQVRRVPLERCQLVLNKEITDINSFTPDDIKIEGYKHLDSINYPVAE